MRESPTSPGPDCVKPVQSALGRPCLCTNLDTVIRMPVHLGFTVDKVKMGHVFLPVLRLSFISIISPMIRGGGGGELCF
jgi:hypothetical protein